MTIEYLRYAAGPGPARPSDKARHPALPLNLSKMSGVTEQACHALREAVERNGIRLPARSMLAVEHETSRGIHILITGWACRYKILPDGRRRVVAFYIPGDICDFDAYVLGAVDQSIAAITAVQVVEIDDATFADLLTRHPGLDRALSSDALMTAAIQRAWTINVGHRAAKQRLAHLLCELYRRSDLAGLVVDGECELPLTQFHLGDACAMTAIHINRVLQELRAEGLLALEHRRLTIHDWPALVDLASFDERYLVGRASSQVPIGTSRQELGRRHPG